MGLGVLGLEQCMGLFQYCLNPLLELPSREVREDGILPDSSPSVPLRSERNDVGVPFCGQAEGNRRHEVSKN